MASTFCSSSRSDRESTNETGFVEDVNGRLSQMDVALLPPSLGVGIEIKVLECKSAD